MGPHLSFRPLKLRPDGFHLNHRRYYSDGLRQYLHGPCPYTRDGLWLVTYDPDDPTSVWVRIPDHQGCEGAWVSLPAVRSNRGFDSRDP